MNIGPVLLKSPLLLAPLAGYTDLPFRQLCREQGAALCFSEMISCHGLAYGQQKTLDMLKTVPEERPVAFQLFGSDPDIMGRAAALLSAHPVDIVDINMGCPVRKVIKKGAGAALMKNISLAERIIKQVVGHTHLPVTVKFRAGWSSDSIIADSFARMAQDAGASAVAVHGRTWSQGFGGKADWSVIAMVKQSVSIPVIGNGDIQCYQDALNMMENTGCDGIMIGRGALGNPWVFKESGRPDLFAPRLDLINRHIQLIKQYLPERRQLFKVKNHVTRYLAGLNGASTLRQKINAAVSISEIKNLLRQNE